VEGRVVSVLHGPKNKPVVEGQNVAKGTVIVQLDARLIKANRDKVKSTLKELDDQEKRNKLAIVVARIEVDRLNNLKEKGVTVAQSDIQKAQLAYEDAELVQDALKTKRATGQAELDALEVQLKLYSLTAPIDGQLGRLLVVPGQTLAVGTLAAEIINVKKEIDVLCFVPPHVAKRLKKGQQARVGGFDEQPAAATAGVVGKVEFIADQAEIDTGNFAVKVRFPNDKLKLQVNTSLRLRVLTSPEKACVTLPESALLEDQDPPGVIVVEDYKKVLVVKTEDGKEKEYDEAEIEKMKQEKKPIPEGKEVEKAKARKLRVKVGIRDRVLHLVEIISVDDPEKKWKGNLETALFVTQRAAGLRNGDVIKFEAEEDEEE
jgi:RND family efflux transporter MFP subunit